MNNLTTNQLLRAMIRVTQAVQEKAGDPPDDRTRRRIERRFVSALEAYYNNQLDQIRAALEANR